MVAAPVKETTKEAASGEVITTDMATACWATGKVTAMTTLDLITLWSFVQPRLCHARPNAHSDGDSYGTGVGDGYGAGNYDEDDGDGVGGGYDYHDGDGYGNGVADF